MYRDETARGGARPRPALQLRTKALVLVLGIVIASLALTVALTTRDAGARMAASHQRAADTLADSLARACEQPLAVGDELSLAIVVDRYVSSAETVFAAVLSPTGDRLAVAYADDALWEEYLAGGDGGCFVGRADVARNRGNLINMHRGDVSSARSADEARLGTVVVGLARAPIHEAMAAHTKLAMLFILTASLLAAVIVRWAVGGWTRRLAALVAATERIAAGDLGHSLAAATSHDELGRLWQAYEEMRSALVDRDQEMRSFNDNLRALVRERTRDLETARDRAEAASRAKSEFLANMSHELRTPMHAVLSFAGFGQRRIDRVDRAKLGEYFAKIQQSAERLLGLLNDVLDLSKLEARAMPLRAAPMRVADHIVAVVGEFESMLQDHELQVQMRSDEVVVVADAERLMQVVRNLLGNAVRFAPRGTVITITVRRTGDGAKISVSDRGPGIPEQELLSVFDKFVQSSKTKTGAGGTGLGLSICREIMELHGGRIWAENRRGGGARFAFTLPAAAEQEPAAVLVAAEEAS